MTNKERLDAEEKVMHPKLHTNKVTFLGREITLEPLPITPQKVIRQVVKSASKSLSKMSFTAEEFAGKENSPEFRAKMQEIMESDEDLDLKIAEAVLDAVWELCQYYKVQVVKYKGQDVTLSTKETLNDICSLAEADNFVKAQLKLQDENDFLLKPLVFIMMVLSATPPTPSTEEIERAIQSTKENYQISPDTTLSVKPGEPDLNVFVLPTPEDNSSLPE